MVWKDELTVHVIEMRRDKPCEKGGHLTHELCREPDPEKPEV